MHHGCPVIWSVNDHTKFTGWSIYINELLTHIRTSSFSKRVIRKAAQSCGTRCDSRILVGTECLGIGSKRSSCRRHRIIGSSTICLRVIVVHSCNALLSIASQRFVRCNGTHFSWLSKRTDIILTSLDGCWWVVANTTTVTLVITRSILEVDKAAYQRQETAYTTNGNSNNCARREATVLVWFWLWRKLHVRDFCQIFKGLIAGFNKFNSVSQSSSAVYKGVFYHLFCRNTRRLRNIRHLLCVGNSQLLRLL
mmetsp:Transcript_12939/g.21442  ORF Transcript_12939/g.21442 Transcript_12939/m.21442 type:complete len:252 (-) Transcript_12939:335-1090(-)